MKLIFNISRILASLFSILGGFFAVYYFLVLITKENIYIALFAILLIVFYEVLAVLTLSNSFKEFFSRNWKLFFIYFGIAVLLYSGSFLLTTNGMMKFVENRVNKTEIIENKSMSNIDSISSKIDIKINKNTQILDSLRTVKFNYQNWQFIKNEANFLQNENINLQNIKDSLITKIYSEQNISLNENTEIVEYSKGLYYLIASIIMSFIVIFNLVFNYLKYNDEKWSKEGLNTVENIEEKNKKLLQENTKLKRGFETVFLLAPELNIWLNGRISMLSKYPEKNKNEIEKFNNLIKILK